jgi:hypothetical protein
MAKWRSACSSTVKFGVYLDALNTVATSFHLGNKLRIAHKDDGKGQIIILSLKGRRAPLHPAANILDLRKLVSSISI